MGIFMDTLEDTLEFRGQFLSSIEQELPTKSSSTITINLKPFLYCDVCHAVVYSREDLEDHVRQIHWKQHVYLRVNGSIVHDDTWIERGIRECELVLLGVDAANVAVRVGKEKYSGTYGTGHRFESLFPPDYEGEARFNIFSPAGITRSIHLYCRRLPEFDRIHHDRLIGNFHREFDSSLQRPDLSVWRSALGPKAGRIEHRYMDGFFEYTLGSYLESSVSSREAKPHLEDAFGLLLPFNTPLAMRTKWLLALKMNAFGVLIGCPEGSVFGAADAFFNRGLDRREPGSPKEMKGSYDLYIDSFSSGFLDALTAYYGNDETQIDRRLGALSAHTLVEDRNNEDKYQLLSARIAVRRGQTVEARRNYEMLRMHPQFGIEAEEFLHAGTR